jgi:hypothetical protein
MTDDEVRADLVAAFEIAFAQYVAGIPEYQLLPESVRDALKQFCWRGFGMGATWANGHASAMFEEARNHESH